MRSRLRGESGFVVAGLSARRSAAVLALCLAAAVVFEGGSPLKPRSIRKRPAVLSAGQLLSATVSGNSGNEYSFRMNAGQLATFRIQQTGNGLRLALFAPSGQFVREYLCDEGGTRTLSIIAQRSGEYMLKLRGQLAKELSTRYQLEWIELRAPDSGDRDNVLAEAALAEADQLASQGREKDSRLAIQTYVTSAKLFAAVGAEARVAEVYLRIGNLYLLLGDLAKSSEYYGEALGAAEKLRDDRLKVAALNGSAAARTVTGATEQALDYCDRALTLAVQCRDRWGMAQALQNLGYYYSWASKYTQSSDYFQQALAIRQELSDYRGQAQTIMLLGFNAADTENLSSAVEYYERAKSLFQAIRDRRGQARVESAIAQLYCKTGRYWEAMDLYGATRDWFESLDEFEVSARMHNNMGVVYFELGLLDSALAHCQKALALFETAGYQSSQGYAHQYIGVMLVALGETKAAIAHQRQAAALFHKVADQRLEATSLCYLGDAYEANGQAAVARKFYDQALKIFTSEQDLRGQAITLASLGRLHQNSGDPQGALELSKKALAINRQIQDRYREYQTLYDIARVERDLGNWQEAKVQIESAVAAVESLRTSVPGPEMRSSFFATTQQCHNLYIDVLMQIHAKEPSNDLAAQALHASEQARARSLLEFLTEAGTSLRKGVDPELLRHEQDLMRSLNASADRRTRLLSETHTNAQLEALEKQISALDDEYDNLQGQIRIRSPQYASLRHSKPLTLEQIQDQLLDDDTLLLEYSLGDKRSYLWLVGKHDLHDYELPPRAAIEALAARVRDRLIARQIQVPGETAKLKSERVRKSDKSYWLEAAKLSRVLLGPAAAELGKKRLVIVPDGFLQYLSFGALPLPQSGDAGESQRGDSDARPLISDHEIVSLPSASTLSVLRAQAKGRKPATKSVAVFADPMFDSSSVQMESPAEQRRSPAASQLSPGNLQEGFELIPLPATRLEAEAIMELVPAGAGLSAIGDAATRDRAISPELKDYRIIHFATHGFADDTNPRMSWIALSTVDAEGKPRNGYLRLLDIYNLNLSADVVVLSACSTAMGKNIKGEGLVGMVRGFMYAGAARIVASLWRVDDQSTAELMKRFYRGMLKDGLSPAAALRKAQVEMSKHARWYAPYHWAAFVLQGEYR